VKGEERRVDIQMKRGELPLGLCEARCSKQQQQNAALRYFGAGIIHALTSTNGITVALVKKLQYPSLCKHPFY
jgi:hypothetical protein